MTDLRRLTGLPVLALTFVVAAALATAMSASSPGTSAHDTSDHFWRIVTPNGMAAEEYVDPAHMAREADLVVVGRVESATMGREWVAAPELLDDPFGQERAYARFATVMIRVEQVLGPTAFPVRKDLVPVEVFLHRPEVLDELRQNVPGERAIFALRNKGADDSPTFFRLVNDAQGVIREFGHRAHLQADVGSGFENVEGVGFASLVESMRAARAEE